MRSSMQEISPISTHELVQGTINIIIIIIGPEADQTKQSMVVWQMNKGLLEQTQWSRAQVR